MEEEITIVNGRFENGSVDEVDIAKFRPLKNHLDCWYDCRCCYWRQISRDKVIKEVDRNYKYFHTLAAIRKRSKQMQEIKSGRRTFQSPRIIKSEVRSFYKNLYKQKDVPLISFQDGLVSRISNEQAQLLELILSDEDIKLAVWECESSKAPGLDGFNFNFIKNVGI